MGEARDYYADLELPRTADLQEVKKQFRKLALKYHPDRNPGRESEVNAKFQIIQSAHEVLGDATEKAKYDASFGGGTARYPTASGRKGNPWSEAAQNFPPPPRRNPPGKPTPSSSGGGAQRWSSRFAAGVPPTAKQYNSADSETKKNAAKAFNTMRKSQAKKPEPPPPPPRTQSGRERAEASFGTRKSSQATRPSADESDPSYRKPVPQYHDIGSQQSRPVPDPLSQFRDNGAQADPRYSSQYNTHGGEKMNSFEGIHRTPSMKGAGDDGPRYSRREDMNNEEPIGSAGAYSKSSFKQRAHRTGSPDKTQAQSNPDSMYANPPSTTSHKIPPPHLTDRKPATSLSYFGSLSSVYNPKTSNPTPSGCRTTPQESLRFEQKLQELLSHLINANDPISPYSLHNYVQRKESADKNYDDSFNFKVDDDSFDNSDNGRSPSRRRPTNKTSFDQNNVDGIDTKFSKEFTKNACNFTAGSAASDAQQSHSTSPNVRQDDAQPVNTTGTASETSAYEAGFNPGGWSGKFGPQTFVPQQAPGGTASPTRASRTNSRKAKPPKSNANNPIVIDDSDGEDLYEWPGRNPQAQGQTTESPLAMDIDTPPAIPPRPQAAARTIYVEPTRPEWRSDEVQPGNDSAAQASQPAPHAGGSEDSEEFRASFADIKNVAPFAPQGSGLKSFADLKDNLPFESKASGEVPVQMPKVQPLVFPTPPTAPRLPPTVAIEGMAPNATSWNKYLDDFGMYLQEWELFNTQVVDHFATRSAHIKRLRESKGYAFLGSRSANEIQEYISWVQQDNDVRRRWNAACEGHEERLGEFMAFRNKMK